MSAPEFLSSEWEFQGVTVTDVKADETELVSLLHRSRAEVASVDPSFQPVEMEEYAGLVEASGRNEAEGKPFRLQIVRNESGEPCGYYHAYGHHPWDGCFFISMFLIAPEHARKGIGHRAVRGIVQQATALGFERILLNVFLGNRDALAFWVEQGFDRIEKLRRREETGQPDRLILERRLTRGHWGGPSMA